MIRLSFSLLKQVESVPEPDVIGKVIEEVVDLAKQINLVSQYYWDKLHGKVGEITNIQIYIAIHGRKLFRSALGGIVLKSVGRNKPTLPQSLELSSPAEKYETFYEHREGRDAPDLSGLTEGNVRSAERLYLERYPQKDAPDPRMFTNFHHYLSEYSSLRGNRHSEDGTRVIRTTSMTQL
ncbi:hypothetical protein TNCV_4499001 [Trichonephila clavipes]|nr:hypothetical protein TNCV_4499001 [Trichonephila clavipes]